MESHADDWVDYDYGDDDDNDGASRDEIPIGTSNPDLPSTGLEGVRKEARERSKNIASNFNTLRSIVERHEAAIQRRWMKKTKRQRLKILLAAWPNMAVSNRPDFRSCRDSLDQSESNLQYRTELMWPYINQEDLSQQRPLLLLINSRGRHTPPNFTAADYSPISCFMPKVKAGATLYRYVMILHNLTNAKDYGKLLGWHEHKDAKDWMDTHKQFRTDEGLLVLEVQERVLTFLVDCCRQILHDIPKETLTIDAFPVQPGPQLQPVGDEGIVESLATMAADAPYRLPVEIDLNRIASLLEAKVAAVEDHLWSLREDPGYYAEQLFDFKEHREEMLKDLDNKPHADLSPRREVNLCSAVIHTVVVEAYMDLEVFSELHRQSKGLLSLSAKYHGSISPGEDLPEEYLMAILTFTYESSLAVKAHLAKIESSGPSSPPMRRFFVRAPPDEYDQDEIEKVLRPYVKMTRAEEDLIFLLNILGRDDEDLQFFGLQNTVDELDRLLQAESSARELISGKMASIIADLSILSQCLGQIGLFHPWGTANFQQICKRNFGRVALSNFSLRGRWEKIIRGLSRSALRDVEGLIGLGMPTDKKFAYPVQKRRTKENTAIMRRAEDNLDAFWSCIDQHLHRKAGNLKGTAVGRLLSSSCVLERTPPWVEPAKGARANPEVNPCVPVKPFSQSFFGLSGGSCQKTLPLAPKGKVKTRGTPKTPSDSPNASGDSPKDSSDSPNVLSDSPNTSSDRPNPTAISKEDSQDLNPHFSVDARALKVFRMLFFHPDVTSTPGEVPWTEFLHAMVSIGFEAEKLYGSGWRFTPTDPGIGSWILFHEPHPHKKLAFMVARQYGRRLRRAYKWTGGTFTPKKKSS